MYRIQASNVRSITSFKPTYGAFVNGKYEIPSNLPTFDVHSPANQLHLCSVVSANADYTDRVVLQAQKNFESGVWSRSDVRLRANVLNNIAKNLRLNIPRLAEMEVAQTGRAIRCVYSQCL
jgi:acyl-CoA reductase-like NAD-dependent aldehyde dehydrogenase